MSGFRRTRVFVIAISVCLMMGQASNAGALGITTNFVSYTMMAEIRDVIVQDDFAYVVNTTNGIMVINVTDPYNPSIETNYAISNNTLGLEISGDLGYFVSDNGLDIINITDPLNPVYIANYSTHRTFDVKIRGNYCYLAVERRGLEILDISDPANITQVGSVYSPGNNYGIAMQENLVILDSSIDGILIIDVSNPASPELLSAVENGTRYSTYKTGIKGEYLYLGQLGGTIKIYDISNPESPAFMRSFGPGSLHGISVYQDWLLVSSYTYGLYIYDVSDPSSPKLRDSLGTGSGTINAYMDETSLYIVAQYNGFYIYNYELSSDNEQSTTQESTNNEVLAFPSIIGDSLSIIIFIFVGRLIVSRKKVRHKQR